MDRDKSAYPGLSHTASGMLFAVHDGSGRHRSEKQYSDAIENYFKIKKIVYEREKALPVTFAGEQEGRNRIDFLVEGNIVLDKSKTDYRKGGLLSNRALSYRVRQETGSSC